MDNEKLVAEIRTIIKSLERMAEILESEEKVEEETAKAEEKSVYISEKEITQLLRRLGIPAHIKGYYYIRTAIMMCVANPELLGAITKELYPEVAKAHDTTSSRAERAIRHAIEVSFDRIDQEIYMEVFQYTVSAEKGRPTNSEYIAALVDYIIMNKNDFLC